MSLTPRVLLLWLTVAAVAGLALALPPFPQPLSYHEFADQRACMGLPNCLDTVTNTLFVLAGCVGLYSLHNARGQMVFQDRREAMPYGLCFFGVVLIGLGSGYYHLAPDNDRLLWDRLPMMLAFMAWFAAIVSERVGPLAGLRVLPLLLAAGIGSAVYWGWSEAQGRGDLRPYLAMQVLPILLIPQLLAGWPPRYSKGCLILAVVGLYLLALVFELGDQWVFNVTGGFASGHSIKHGIAALAVLVMVLYLKSRRAKEQGGTGEHHHARQ